MIFVVKYRKKLLSNPLGDDMKLILLVSSEPSVSPLQIVNRLKQMSTIEIWKLYAAYLHRQFWKEKTFWSDGYFVSSIGNVSEKTIKEYIEKQG